MKKYIVFILVMVVFLMQGCTQMNTGAQTANVILNADSVSGSIDDLQEKYGSLSSNQWALMEIDRIQMEIRVAMYGGVSSDGLRDLHGRALEVYDILYEEVAVNWYSIPEEDQFQFKLLNRDLINLNDDITALMSNGDTQHVATIMMKILDITSAGLKVYSAYEDLDIPSSM